MGTNYYWESDPCVTCSHVAERRHICKSHVSFYSGRTERDDFTGEATHTSWADWRAWLEQAGGRIVNEYGKVVPLDEFVDDVESVPRVARRRQFDWVLHHPWPTDRFPAWPLVDRTIDSGRRNHWLDPDGFSFTDSEFS